MEKKYFESYNSLSLNNKREILLKEVADLLSNIEEICKKKKKDINKLKSSYFIKNKDLLLDGDYYDLLFVYITYIKEDLASLL
jgi:hypothetical protein